MPESGSRIWVPLFLYAQQHCNPGKLRCLAEPWNLADSTLKRAKSHLPQGLPTKQDSTHQAFSRVVVHSRRSKLEASS